MPGLLKRRWYDVNGTQCSVDVRGIWDNDAGARNAAAPGNPLCKLAAFRGPFQQEEFRPCFVMLCAILEGLFKVDGRSVLQIICSHGKNRSAALAVALSALFECPVWLSSYGDAFSEWWAVAQLPGEIIQQLEEWRSESRSGHIARLTLRAFRDLEPRLPMHLEGRTLATGRNPLLDAVRLDVWRVAPGVLLELDELRLDEKCMRAVGNLAGHSDDGAKFVREIFQVLQRNSADLRTYSNPSAAITSACRKELDRLRPEIAGLPGSSGRSD
ncbi:mao [Symbiodinium sp. CCMP2592]|nr:mao [Symbiodinium sp. CCMP2592]